MLDNANARIERSIIHQNGERSIRATIVDANNLNLAQCLTHETVETLPEITLSIVNGNNDRNFRVHSPILCLVFHTFWYD